jgi:hypothetical protein
MIAMASNGHLQQRSTDKKSYRGKNSLLDAYATTYTQELGDEGDLVGRFDLDT